MYKQLRIKRWTGTFLIPFLLVFVVLGMTKLVSASDLCGHSIEQTWTQFDVNVIETSCSLIDLKGTIGIDAILKGELEVEAEVGGNIKITWYSYQWEDTGGLGKTLHNSGKWEAWSNKEFILAKISGAITSTLPCKISAEVPYSHKEKHDFKQNWEPDPFPFPKCCQNSDCDAYDGYSCVPDQILEEREYNNCVSEECEYTVVSSFDCNSQDGFSCDGNILKEMDWSCALLGGCVGATLSSTNCDSLDVAATCDSPGKDYSCSGDSCQFTEIPKLTGNQDCPECTTPSDCGTDTAATCSSSGTSYSCSSGSCGSTSIPQLTGDTCDPTVVTLISFTITVSDGNVILEWETASEIDNAGFYIKRSEEKDGEYIRITDLIPAEGGERDGATYTFTDKNVEDGVTYYYKLEDIDFSGVSIFRGPISNSPDPDKVLIIGPVVQNAVFTPDTPPIFEWAEGRYSEFKFQFSDDNGQTFYEIPADNQWMKETSIMPQAAAWEEYAKMKKGQIIFWRVVGQNEQGKAFSEVGSLTIE